MVELWRNQYVGLRLKLFYRLFPSACIVPVYYKVFDESEKTSNSVYHGIRAVRKHMKSKRTIRGLIFCVTKLKIRRKRIAERLYEPDGIGYMVAKTNYYKNAL